MRANRLAAPAIGLEIDPRGLLIREALEELIVADGFRLVGNET